MPTHENDNGLNTPGITSKIFAFRVPARLDKQIDEIAQRDNNTRSATARRLLTRAINSERAEQSSR